MTSKTEQNYLDNFKRPYHGETEGLRLVSESLGFECKLHGLIAPSKYEMSNNRKVTACRVCNMLEGLPKRYRHAVLSDFEDKVTVPVEKARSNNTNILILGPVGTGKTHLAAAIFHERAKDRQYSIYSTVRRMSQRIISDKTAEKFETSEYLILDEIGRQFDTQAEGERIFDLINYRYNEMLPTVFIGNLTAEDFKASIGEAAADRIRENVTVITLNGESRRGKKS